MSAGARQRRDSTDPQRMLLACLAVAIVLRLLVIYQYPGELTRDRDAYLAIARGVAAGQGFVDPPSRRPTAFRPPFYPIQAGCLMVVLPVAAAVAVANVFWGAAAVWGTWKAGLWLGLGKYRGVAAGLVAIDPMLLLYSTQPMTEVTCAGLAALFVYWLVRQDVPLDRRQFVAGVVFGLLVMCRPTFWPLAGLALIVLVCADLQHRWHHVPTPGDVSRPSIPWQIVVGTLIVVAPWFLRNQWTLGSPILTTTHGGYTLLLGNNPVFYADVVDRGWGTEWPADSFDRWSEQLQARLAVELGPDATEVQRDRWQSQQARQFISANPGRFLRAAGYRIQSLWSTIPQQPPGGAPVSNLILLVGRYYAIVLLAFAAGSIYVVVQTARGSAETRGWWPLLALVLTVQLVHLAYWTNARMRAPIVPVISLLAVAGMPALDRWHRQRQHAASSGTVAPPG